MRWSLASLLLATVGCAATEGPEASEGGELAFPDETGELKHGLLLADPENPTPIEFEQFGDDWVLEGDILLHPGLVMLLDDSTATVQQPVAAVTKEFRWPDGVVPYVIDQDLPDKHRVTDAIAHWHAKTHVRFVKRDSQADYVFFTRGKGCAAELGRTGGRQWVKIGSICGTGAVVHEIGHAVGLWHEQSRADRAAHVNVRWNNIQDGLEYNFQTYLQQGFGGVDLGAYNFGSIMHYDSYAFSKNGKPTIVKEDGSLITANRSVLNAKDIAGVAKLYPAK